MSSTILTNWTVYYQSDAGTAGGGAKQIRWTGTTGTNTINELYSALMHLFDNASQNDADDSIPMKAVTPTLYEIGSFDAGDKQPWFIDFDSVKHLTGAGLNTVKWARTGGGGGDAGIIRITRSASTSNIVTNDIGAAINNGTATGWLLYVSGTNLWIRPTSNATIHDWTATSGTITCNTHNDTQVSGTASAESIWSNIYTLGTIESNTAIYVYQNSSPLTPWWSTGHIDILILVNDFGTLIDSGLLTIYARQYSKLYDHSIVTVASGGRTPVPLATAPDVNNATGTYAFDFDNGSGTFVTGEVITSGTKKGVITSVIQTNPTGRLEYYLIYPHTQFANNDAITAPSGGACDVNEPTAIETVVAGYTDITITFSSITRDLNNNNGLQPYDVEVDCNSRPLTEVYQYLKYVVRETSTTSINGANGEAYLAAQSSYTSVKTAPFGTFAGGKFFGARGVWLKNVASADANNYQLIDADNDPQSPPQSITLTVNGLVVGDQVAVFETTGVGSNTINKNMFTIDSTQPTGAGVTEVRVNEIIPNDTPGKTSGGWIRLVHRDADNYIESEERIAFSAWNNNDQPSYSTFTVSSFNCTLNSSDTAYVPYLDITADATSESVALIYYQIRNITVRVRKSGILPFMTPSQITNSNLTIPATRNPDPNT